MNALFLRLLNHDGSDSQTVVLQVRFLLEDFEKLEVAAEKREETPREFIAGAITRRMNDDVTTGDLLDFHRRVGAL